MRKVISAGDEMMDSVIDRLLKSDEPSVRFKVLVNVLCKEKESIEIKKVQQKIKSSQRVKLLLSERGEDGKIPFHPYAKWYGGHWVLACLADMRMPKVKRHQEIRSAYDDALDILKKSNAQKIGGVLHCFSGNQKQANFGLSLGFYLSFNGTLTYPKSKAKDIAKNTPIDFILTETDCPYLSPAPFRGKRNKPSYVRYVVEKLSEIFSDSSFEEVEEITEKNAFKLFKLGRR